MNNQALLTRIEYLLEFLKEGSGSLRFKLLPSPRLLSGSFERIFLLGKPLYELLIAESFKIDFDNIKLDYYIDVDRDCLYSFLENRRRFYIIDYILVDLAL